MTPWSDQGQGVLSEDRTHLADAPYEGAARAEVYHDTATLMRWQGERVRLTAQVTESRLSSHVGDLALGIEPAQPTQGEVIDLGVGRLGAESGYDGRPDIFLRPEDGRGEFWIDPRLLYRLHDQTVEVYAELTADPPSPAPQLARTPGKRAFDNGDGTFQVVGVAEGEPVRVLPRIVALGDDLFRITHEAPGKGREIDIE
jgi:hypothetical protein